MGQAGFHRTLVVGHRSLPNARKHIVIYLDETVRRLMKNNCLYTNLKTFTHKLYSDPVMFYGFQVFKINIKEYRLCNIKLAPQGKTTL